MRRAHLHLGWVLLLVSALLAGCAGWGSSGTEAGASSAADESDVQRRARIRTELASAYLTVGKTAIALEEAKQAQAIDPTYSPAQTLRGVIHLQMQDGAGAQRLFEQALALNARDADALHNLGLLYCDQAQYARAMPLFERALAVPGYTKAGNTWLALGVCQARAGQVDAAQRSLLRSLEYDATHPIALYSVANMLFKQGDAQRAQVYARRLNQTERANAESLWLGIKIERRLGDVEAERQLGDQLLRRFADSAEGALYIRGAFDD